MNAELRAELEQRRSERDPIYWFEVHEASARALKEGIVPEEIQAMARMLVDQEADLWKRTAERDAADQAREPKPKRRTK